MAAEAPARPAGGNLLTQKVGPLATWEWLLIVTIAGGAYYLFTASSTSASGSAGSTAGASQVPDIILQDYGAPVSQTQTQTVPPPQPPPRPGPPPAPKPVRKPAPRPRVTHRPGPPVRHPVPSPIFNGSYRVRKGETLAEVAKKFGISREELAHANGFGTGAGLRTGQVLRVPSPAPGGRPNKAP